MRPKSCCNKYVHIYEKRVNHLVSQTTQQISHDRPYSRPKMFTWLLSKLFIYTHWIQELLGTGQYNLSILIINQSTESSNPWPMCCLLREHSLGKPSLKLNSLGKPKQVFKAFRFPPVSNQCHAGESNLGPFGPLVNQSTNTFSIQKSEGGGQRLGLKSLGHYIQSNVTILTSNQSTLNYSNPNVRPHRLHWI